MSANTSGQDLQEPQNEHPAARNRSVLTLHKLMLAIEQSADSIVITDPSGTIEYVNPKFTEVTGYTAEEAIGQNPRILKGGLSTEDFYKNLWDTITSGKVWKGEFLNKKKSGDFFWELAQIAPVRDENNQIINFIATKLDITEQKRAEQALSDTTEKLRELNATKDKFFSIIAHDLRNPFNGILGFARLLKMSYEKYTDEERKELIDFVYVSAVKANELLDNLLEWSLSQANRIGFSPESCTLSEIIDLCLQEILIDALNKNQKIIIDPSTQVSVYADKNLVAFVIRNLLTNAVKFTPRNGEIRISAGYDEKEVTISVSDTGIGIEQENIGKLFRIDTKYSMEGTDDEPSTGLGLILCKEFVEKHGGRIWAESQVGRGSVFSFTIPEIK